MRTAGSPMARKRLENEMQKLIDAGLFSDKSEITREALRDIFLKYKYKTNQIPTDAMKKNG